MPDPDASSMLNFQITVAGWRRVPRLRGRLREVVQVTADNLPQKFRFPFTANLLLSGNNKIRRLNRDFRGIDKPTNVLSFPQFGPAELPLGGKGHAPPEMGDIILAYQYVVNEARKERKILINHISHLVIHGLLHLFGYDHEGKAEAQAMEKLEIKIMRALGLPHPYAPPAAAPTNIERRKK